MKKNVMICLAACLMAGCAENTPLYKDASAPVERRVRDLVARMTLDEKIAQLQHIHSYQYWEDGSFRPDKIAELMGDRGIGCVEHFTLPGEQCAEVFNAIQRYAMEETRLGIPVFTVTESLHGSVHDGSTIFPQTIALGSTFDPELAYRMTSAIARELKAQGIWQTLSPGADVVRDLRWGRVEECFGEDQNIVTQMSTAQVRGYLDGGISPMLKPFGAHGSPTGGLNLASVACGERELRSVYLKPYEEIVRNTGIMAVMSSYNSWNYLPNSSSHWLQTELLRDQWGFRGYVYSDWGAVAMLRYFHKTADSDADAAVQALTSGLDLEASGNCYDNLKELVEKGVLDEKHIDLAASRVLRTKFTLGMFDNPYREAPDYASAVHTPEHIALAREIADESIVLVKNDGGVLPLDPAATRSVALIGPNAGQVQFGDYTWSRDNRDGTTLLDAVRENYPHIRVNHAKGCDLMTGDRSGFGEAVDAARRSDVSIVVVGSSSASLARDYSGATCGEGFDLSDLDLTGVQEDLVKAVHATGKPVVVVLLAGKPFSVPWIKENIPAFAVQWYPGEQGGYALADMLFGKTNPSGKLNYSFPQSVGHLPCYYNHLPTDKGFYKEPGTPEKPGRDYVFSSPAPLWAFGHGLSYTSFEYLSMETSKEDYSPCDTVEVRVRLRNTGERDGKEVVQIYVRDIVSSIVTPVHELKGFRKVSVAAGAQAEAVVRFPVSELALWNRDMTRVVEPGEFEIQAAAASDDIRIRKIITVEKDRERKIVPESDPGEASRTDGEMLPVTVTGIVRDVQGNAVAGITVSSGGRSVATDDKGHYEIEALATGTLTVSGGAYREQAVQIDGRTVVNVAVLHAGE